MTQSLPENLPSDSKSKPKTSKLSAEKALPQAGVETFIKVIKGYVVASNGGETPVSYKDVGSVTGLNPTAVSRNNSFLSESNIIVSPKYGFFVPTENAVRYAREAAWDETAAKWHLRKSIINTWYGQVALQNFAIRSNLSRDDLRRAFGIKSGATEADSSGLSFLIDFLVYSGLIVESENGLLAKGNTDDLEFGSVDSVVNNSGIAVQGGIVSNTVVEGVQIHQNPSNPIMLTISLRINSFDELTDENAQKLKEWLLKITN